MTVQTDSPGMKARTAAHQALGQTLRRRRPLDSALDETLGAHDLSPRDAGFARAIANETLRRFGQLDDLLHKFVPKPPPPHRAGQTLEILLAGACELLFLDIPAHAAVDGANRLAAQDPKAVHFKPLINATLRRISREGRGIVEAQDGPRLNTPDWLWTRWCDAYGETATRAMAAVHAQTPPLDLNVLRDFTVVSEAGNSDARRERKDLPGGIVRLERAGAIEALAGFTEGLFWIQDFAASLPVRLFGDVRGRRVVDLCAAPGGKTAQLCALGAAVVAVDRDESRLSRLEENLRRLKYEAQLVSADVRDFQPAAPAPFVLLDAPCSSTGTIRRHPELPWIKDASDIAACSATAQDLFEAAAQLVAPGGKLVYAVCSLEPEEGPDQIEHFLRGHNKFRRAPVLPDELFGLAECIDGAGNLRTLPCHFAESGGMDGFFAARLVRL